MTPPNPEQHMYTYANAVKSMLDAIDQGIPYSNFNGYQPADLSLKDCCEVAIKSCEVMIKMMDEVFESFNQPKSRCS
jgi:hypothetical protein